MMVPAETLLALTVVFFLREVYIRSKQKPNDYASGYKQAAIDIATEWNRLAVKGLPSRNFLDTIGKFIQEKSKGM